ncbi:hypothetical protein SADUNF_Sadunf07G0068200 [Salix dunnii]|uniref:Uncharacterized protein n=1 Tax=Salix dunnii TaxID=1413687 RepID=A0A835K3K7_9ROSI|nr:hypothetical protein SADUNF_Sadunf07G0068200 [Salix dunnii]
MPKLITILWYNISSIPLNEMRFIISAIKGYIGGYNISCKKSMKNKHEGHKYGTKKKHSEDRAKSIFSY